MAPLWEIATTPYGKLVVGISLILFFIATGWYLLERLRDGNANDRPAASDLLTNLPQLRGEGAVSEEEYRTIKTALEDRLQQELNDAKRKG